MDDNVPIISTDINGLAWYIKRGFDNMTQGYQSTYIRGIRFYLTDSQDAIQTHYDFFSVESHKFILLSSEMYLLRCNWYADWYWKGDYEDFEITELDNPCDYEEILSVIKKYFEERCSYRLLDSERIFIDINSIEGLPPPDEILSTAPDDPQELELVPCDACKYNHTKCGNSDGLFYQIPCNIVKKCEQGEAC